MTFATGDTVVLAPGQAHANDDKIKSYPVSVRDPGPHDPARKAANPDIVNPAVYRQRYIANLRYSFSDAHVRKGSAGWTRQVTKRELGIPTTIAGMDMRLNTADIRELH